MSRNDVLVTAEWAELNLDNPNVVFVEVDEDTTAYRRWSHRGCGEARLEDRLAGSGTPRLRQPGPVLRPVVASAASPTTTR